MNAGVFETNKRERQSLNECAVIPAVANLWRRMGDGEVMG